MADSLARFTVSWHISKMGQLYCIICKRLATSASLNLDLDIYRGSLNPMDHARLSKML